MFPATRATQTQVFVSTLEGDGDIFTGAIAVGGEHGAHNAELFQRMDGAEE